MTIHVNIGEAKTRLSELVAAALRGEEVVLARAGAPQVRLTPVGQRSEEELAARAARRRAAFGMWKARAINPDGALEPIMSDDELEERWNQKFGAPA